MKANKVLFIIPGSPDYLPYVDNYLKIASDCKRDFDVVCWDRHGDYQDDVPSNYKVYNHTTGSRYSPIRKLIEIYGFYRFVRRSTRRQKYIAVFTFTIADSLFFGPWLSRCYKSRFVFDIRDYSPIIDNVVFRAGVKLLLKNSCFNVISSNGFRHWLPEGYDYIVCHNTDIEKVRHSLSKENDNYFHNHNGKIKVLTIGNLRDVKGHLSVINAFVGNDEFELHYVGGGVSNTLQEYCHEKGITNVVFTGRYRKENEDGYVRNCDFMNVIESHSMIADFLMSNRFYLSVRFRKPMIVNDGCFQADIIRRYGLGVVYAGGTNLCDCVKSYWKNNDWKKYDEGCAAFLKDVCKDMDEFRYRVERLIRSE